MNRTTLSAIGSALAFVALAVGPSRAQTQANKKPAAESYIGCLERVAATSTDFILTSVRPADQKTLVGGLSNKRYRVIPATPSVDVQSWAGYEVTVTGTVAPAERQKPAEARAVTDDPAKAAESLPRITVISVKRHGMTCPG